MPKYSQLSFNGGEMTEFMDPRIDVQKYAKGCRTMENFYPLPYGGALARPGTKHGGLAKHADKKCRLRHFAYSTTTTFDIEMGHEYFRFWKDQAAVDAPTPAAWATITNYVVDDYVTESSIEYRCIEAHTSGTFATDLAAAKWEVLSVLEVTSPYQEEDLFQIQMEQVRDVVYTVHPDHDFRKLTRYADDDWRLSAIDWGESINYPPLAPSNIDESQTLEVTGGDPTGIGNSITIESVGYAFQEDQVGDFMMIGHNRDETSIRYEITTTGQSDSLYVLGDWAFQTTGTGEYKVTLEVSDDNSTWTTRRQYDIDGTQANQLITGT